MKKTFTIITLSILLLLTVLPLQTSAATADTIITSAKKYLGVPYVFGGTTPRGFDCSGFLKYVFNENGLDLPRTASQQYTVGQPVAKNDLKKGDLVFFETYKKGPSHSGIYLGDGTFISATSSKGVSIVSNYLTWKRTNLLSMYQNMTGLILQSKRLWLMRLPLDLRIIHSVQKSVSVEHNLLFLWTEL